MKLSRFFNSLLFCLALVTSLAVSILPVRAAGDIRPMPGFMSFVNSVKDGQAGLVRGVYLPGLFALRVTQQPANEPGFVSPFLGTVTEFKAARDAGNIGLLAHNTLAGQDFSAIKAGQEVRVVYGDGKVEYFKVTRLLRYQALQPRSMVSDFLDLESGERLTWQQVFKKTYQGAQHVTFQTCIERNGDQNWGRLFVIAVPAAR